MGLEFMPARDQRWGINGEIPVDATRYFNGVPSTSKTESVGELAR